MQNIINYLKHPIKISKNSLGKYWKNSAKKYYGLDDLDKKLEIYIDYDNGFFVELGANDGETQSNTLYFEKFRNWKGVLIEPVPHNYLACKKHRSEHTKIYCNACTSFEYADKFVEIFYSNLMSTPVGLESDIPDPLQHATNGKRFLNPEEEIFSFGAIATPLNNLLIDADAPRLIDLLSLDVEGAEIEVLKGIDHDQFRFRVLCIESRDNDKLSSYLKKIDYDFAEQLSNMDYIFIDKRNI